MISYTTWVYLDTGWAMLATTTMELCYAWVVWGGDEGLTVACVAFTTV